MTTLGSGSDALRTDGLRLDFQGSEERFYLHYFFPPSSVGETGRVGGPGRCGGIVHLLDLMRHPCPGRFSMTLLTKKSMK